MSNELPVPEGPLPQGSPLPPPFYWPLDPTLFDQRRVARDKLRRYNSTGFSTLPTADLELQRAQILSELFGKINPAKPPFIEPPFQCDYGSNIEVGDDCYMNFGCCILDCAKVTIGNNVLFGPNVQIYCPGHPLDPVLRNGVNGPEFGLPVKVGNDVWIGGGAILLPGVTVGDGSVVGAGGGWGGRGGDEGCGAAGGRGGQSCESGEAHSERGLGKAQSSGQQHQKLMARTKD